MIFIPKPTANNFTSFFSNIFFISTQAPIDKTITNKAKSAPPCTIAPATIGIPINAVKIRLSTFSTYYSKFYCLNRQSVDPDFENLKLPALIIPP